MVPVMGYGMEPSIVFGEQVYAFGNTCINQLRLPLGLPKTEAAMENLDLSFMNTYFGLI